jgi:bacteriocin biosynthesis cyclodehydratase domain-containing protein
MTQPVLLVPVGPFGDAIARHLEGLRLDTVRESATDAGFSLLTSARIIVVAAWRPVVALCEGIDRASRRLNRPFVPLVIEGATLSIGPVVRPGAAGCWHCWIRRRNQHDPFAAERAAVAAVYDACPDAGPRGYLEAAAVVGAAQLSRTIERIDRDDCAGGELWQMHLLTRAVTTSTVIGVDGCPYCGLGRPLQDRSWRELQTCFAERRVATRD